MQVSLSSRMKMNPDSYMFRFEFENKQFKLSLEAT